MGHRPGLAVRTGSGRPRLLLHASSLNSILEYRTTGGRGRALWRAMIYLLSHTNMSRPKMRVRSSAPTVGRASPTQKGRKNQNSTKHNKRHQMAHERTSQTSTPSAPLPLCSHAPASAATSLRHSGTERPYPPSPLLSILRILFILSKKLWLGSRHLEPKTKNSKNTPSQKHCPVCFVAAVYPLSPLSFGARFFLSQP